MINPLKPAKAAVAVALAVAAFSAAALPNRIATTPSEALQLLSAATGGALTNRSSVVDAYATVQALPGRVLVADNVTAAPLARAQSFLSSFGAISGVTDAVNQLALTRISPDRAGNTHVHLNQMERGLPVFGARLVVHMNEAGITGMNGVFIDGLGALSTTPSKSVAELRGRALAAGAKLHPGKTLQIESTRLMFFRSGLLKGVETQKNHLAYEVMLKGGTPAYPIRERIMVDAHSGYIINRINEIQSALNREIYTPNQDVPPVMPEGSPIAPADEPLQLDDRTATSSRVPLVSPLVPAANLYFFAGGTYALYENLFGVGGYDFTRPPEAGQVQKSVYLVNEACPNAYWNGDSTNYCPAFDADDVVSHEWSHAYTEYTSGLVYQYQSGALNEGYSDIFGELYDLTNGREGPLGLTLTEGEYFKNGGSRWVVGEDLSETAAELLLRDMWDPDDFTLNIPFTGLSVLAFAPSPGSVITSENYYCDAGDNGGVHVNSGVPNHAFAMLVDGRPNANDPSVFNGVEIPAIGMTKAAHIYFHAQNNYQTPTTNFSQHADALERSCGELIGATLNDVTGAPSPEKITAADCAAVSRAILATEMRINPKEKCGYVTVLKAESTTPALCPAGEFVFPTFKETWEAGAIPSGWVQTKNITGDYDSPTFDYSIASELPPPHTGKALFARNDGDGTCAAGGDASGSIRIDSPEITVPEDASFLSFAHFMQSEQGFDGGNLKYSIDGGAFALVPQGAFSYNEHTGVFGDGPLLPIPDPIGLPGNGNNTSPLAGEAAWTGSDQGEATGSWGTTVVKIAELGAAKGQKIKFRWEFGQDGCGGNLGWFVDDTQVFYCSKTAPADGGVGGNPVPPGTPSVGGGVSGGRFGGGALGLMALLPLAALALRRRRRAA